VTCRCAHAPSLPVLALPLGTNGCDCCGAISPVYDLFATCTDCRDQFCPACSATAREDDERGSWTICRRCAASEAEVNR